MADNDLYRLVGQLESTVKSHGDTLKNIGDDVSDVKELLSNLNATYAKSLQKANDRRRFVTVTAETIKYALTIGLSILTTLGVIHSTDKH